MGGSETGEAELKVGVGSEGVGGVEAEVADEGRAVWGDDLEEPGGADKEGAIEAEEEIGDAGFAGFQNAGAGDAGGEASGFDAFDGGAEAVEVEVIESNTVGPEGDGGGKLFRIADQEMELGSGVGRGVGS